MSTTDLSPVFQSGSPSPTVGNPIVPHYIEHGVSQVLPSVSRLPLTSYSQVPLFHPSANPEATVCLYPSLHDLENLHMEYHPLLFAAAKWFSPIEVRAFEDIRHIL